MGVGVGWAGFSFEPVGEVSPGPCDVLWAVQAFLGERFGPKEKRLSTFRPNAPFAPPAFPTTSISQKKNQPRS